MYMSRSPLFCMFLAIIVATTPSVAVAAEGFDPALLSKDTVAAGLAFPHRMLHAPGMELFPHEIAKVASLEQMGIDLTTIEQVQLAVEKFAPGIPPNFGVKIVFQQPVDLDSFVERAGVPTKPVEYKGTTYQQIDQPSSDHHWLLPTAEKGCGLGNRAGLATDDRWHERGQPGNRQRTFEGGNKKRCDGDLLARSDATADSIGNGPIATTPAAA